MAGRQITRVRYAALARMAGHVLMAGCGTARPATAPASAASASAASASAASASAASASAAPASAAPASAAPASAAPASAAPAGTLVAGALRAVAGTATYLGTVAGTAALIGITVHGTRARAYLCDGMPGRAVTLADWFTGRVRGGTLDAVSGQHRVRLTARLGGPTAAGTITLADGLVYGFTAPLATPGGRAGVFERTGRLLGLPFSAGRIVLPGGGQRGAAEYPTGPATGHSTTYLPLGPI